MCEKKAQLITDWEAADMAHGLPIPGCASCGILDLTLEYSRRNVSELPTYFRLNVQRCSELELLGADGSNGVVLYSSDGSASRVDISPVFSSYQHHSTGERFHLHPELVDKSGDMSTVLLCQHCDNKSMPPRMSIANNIDLGLLSRIDFRLETPSALEKMLKMSKVWLFFPLSQLPAGASNLVFGKPGGVRKKD